MSIDRETSGNLMKWAARASVSVALILLATKTGAWWLSQSVAMLGSATDSGLDLMASVVTLLAIKTALQPADDDHRFGHGKAEALAGMFQAAIMGGSAVFLLFESIARLANPIVIQQSELVMKVSILAILLSLVLVLFQSYVVKKTKSIAISGDHLHYRGDLLLNACVIVSAYLSSVGYIYADSLFGFMIALYIAKGSYDVARPAVDMLMDREFPEGEREDIFNVVMGSPGVIGLHDLRTRTSGRDRFIQMHIEVKGSITVSEGHFIADEVEATLGETFPDTDILIHIDPPTEKSDDLTVKELL